MQKACATPSDRSRAATVSSTQSVGFDAFFERKERLFAFGDLEEQDSSARFDTSLFKAVKRFQHRFGLSEDGVIGKAFVQELNIPVIERLKQIPINLER